MIETSKDLLSQNTNKKFKVIDGSQGEGGGQVLRSALSLAAITQQNIELINIRAGRKKPGLLRQHLTSLLAAQEICHAEVEGAELGSERIRFAPKTIKAGAYHFAISTAGSTALVCQTILPILLQAEGESKVIFEGGTHNGMSPSLCFLQQSYFPILEKMGAKLKVDIESLGFYPAGGGKWQLSIQANNKQSALRTFKLSNLDVNNQKIYLQDHAKAQALCSQLPMSIAKRELKAIDKYLGFNLAQSNMVNADTIGPGNSLLINLDNKTHDSVFEVTGEVGLSAEKLAKKACLRVKQFINAKVAVEEHLADQLLIPMVLAKQGRFTTTKPSLHTLTNIDVIKQMTGIEIKCTQVNDKQWQIALL